MPYCVDEQHIPDDWITHWT